MLRYLAVLAVMLACFTGDVSAVSDQEFQDMQRMMNMEISQLKEENQQLFSIVNQLQALLKTEETQLESVAGLLKGLVQNTTIEERVTLLELQMTEVYDDVSLLFENDDFLFDEQVIQDERILTLEQDADQIEDDVESLQVTALELDFRVTELEENGGSDGNSSISELEERVETLEGTVADHETRITSNAGDIDGLEESSADHETRLTAAEENIQGLQMTDINHDTRITALEENGGGGTENDTIAFHAALTSYDTIAIGETVKFNVIVLNEGNGYNSTTGVFTVPPGGDGVYYFSTFLLVDDGEYAWFDMRLNDDVICTADGDHNNSGTSDTIVAMCSAVASVMAGDEVNVVLIGSIDNTPLWEDTVHYFHGFNGFRI